jgi:hypothetical protein
MRGAFPAIAIGAPSMDVRELHDGDEEGGVETVIVRKTKYARKLTSQELGEVRRVAARMAVDAEAMSQGHLSLRILRDMGHPYGMGRRKGLGRLQGRGRVGVSNRAIVNRQTGTFAHSWSYRVIVKASSIEIHLRNISKPAVWLAFGTRKMKAHGPNTAAPVRELTALDAAVRTAAAAAYWRGQAVAGLGVSSA